MEGGRKWERGKEWEEKRKENEKREREIGGIQDPLHLTSVPSIQICVLISDCSHHTILVAIPNGRLRTCIRIKN